MEYSLVELVGKGKNPRCVTLHIVDHDDEIRLVRLNDRLIITILRHLNEAKQADPAGFYLPVIHKPSKTGDEIFVLPDGFSMLGPHFKALVRRMYLEQQDSTVRYSSRGNTNLRIKEDPWNM
jgi:hypothetical protein